MEDQKIMSLGISEIPGLHSMTFGMGKREAGGVTTQENKSQPEAYWTPERMRDAVPRNIEIETPDPEADPKVPDDSEGQGEAKPGFAPGFAPDEKIQLEAYWTSGNMRDAIPPNMEIDMPKPEADPKIPADETPVSATSGGLNSEEYWTPERMRDAVASNMGIDDMPELASDSKISANVDSVSTTANGSNSEKYWTPDRIQDAVPRDMGVDSSPDIYAKLRTSGRDLIQKYQQFWASEWQQSVKILA